jgi:non-ribosomal peptide synthase protein (TIGR01720 family)
LLSAIVPVLARWASADEIQIDIEGHGREAVIPDVDLLRTVGWFTSVYPVILEAVHDAADPGTRLRSVKEQLRGVPNRGFDFGVVKYLDDPATTAERLGRWADSQVLFNYLGQWDRRISGAGRLAFAAPIAVCAAPEFRRDYLLEINAIVFDGRLRIDWTWSEDMYDRATVAGLAREALMALHELIDHSLSTGSSGFTPSDFPTADLSQTELDRLIADFGE